jgi:hypothetical protein
MIFKKLVSLFGFAFNTTNDTQAASNKDDDHSYDLRRVPARRLFNNDDIEMMMEPFPYHDDPTPSKKEVSASGRSCINPKLTQSGEVNHNNMSEADASSLNAAFKRAFECPDALIDLSEEYNIPTFSLPDYILSLPFGDYNILDMGMHGIFSHKAGEPELIAPHIEVFHAERKCLAFHYFRFCQKLGVFDITHQKLSPEDVHRLYVCGYITDDDVDFPVGRSLLAEGARRRIVSLTDQPTSRKEPNRPLPLYWTVAKVDKKPTTHEILVYISKFERARLERHPRNHTSFMYTPWQRPRFNNNWVIHWQIEHGEYGLHENGISDERAIGLIKSHDWTYLTADRYAVVKRGRKRSRKLLPKYPTEDQRLDKRTIMKLIPRIQHIIPDIYLTEPPLDSQTSTSTESQSTEMIRLFSPTDVLSGPVVEINGRNIAKLPKSHCQYQYVHWSKGGAPIHDPETPAPKPTRPIKGTRRIDSSPVAQSFISLTRQTTMVIEAPVPDLLPVPPKNYKKRQRERDMLQEAGFCVDYEKWFACCMEVNDRWKRGHHRG